MQKLNRFVTYIYSYRDYERDVNVGFAKVDCRGEYVRMEIQIRKKTMDKEEAVLYLLAGTAENPVAVPVGTMPFEKETGYYKGRFPAENISRSGYEFGQVTGLYLKSARELFASQWVEEDLNLANVKIWERPEEKAQEPEPLEPLEGTKQQKMPEEAKLPQADRKEPEEKRTGKEPVRAAENATIRATEEKPLYDWRYEWERLDSGPGSELVLGLALWTRNKGKS